MLLYTGSGPWRRRPGSEAAAASRRPGFIYRQDSAFSQNVTYSSDEPVRPLQVRALRRGDSVAALADVAPEVPSSESESAMENVAEAAVLSPTSALSDHSLLRRLRSGDQDAATMLYYRYAHRLLALARKNRSAELASRVDAEDIVQSVFRIFFRRAAEGHYDVPAGEDLWKLLLVLALNKIRAERVFHRAAKRDARLTAALEQPVPDTAGRNREAAAFLEVMVREALERLPAQNRAMVELRLAGHEVAEIAQLTTRSKRTVERLLQESRRQLHALLADEE